MYTEVAGVRLLVDAPTNSDVLWAQSIVIQTLTQKFQVEMSTVKQKGLWGPRIMGIRYAQKK